MREVPRRMGNCLCPFPGRRPRARIRRRASTTGAFSAHAGYIAERWHGLRHGRRAAREEAARSRERYITACPRPFPPLFVAPRRACREGRVRLASCEPCLATHHPESHAAHLFVRDCALRERSSVCARSGSSFWTTFLAQPSARRSEPSVTRSRRLCAPAARAWMTTQTASSNPSPSRRCVVVSRQETDIGALAARPGPQLTMPMRTTNNHQSR